MLTSETTQIAASNGFIVCPECDQLQQRVHLSPGETALCMQCGAKLYAAEPNLDKALAIALAAAIFFIIAIVSPLIGLKMQSTVSECTLPGSVAILWHQGMWSIATLVLFTTILFPAVEIALTITLLAGLKSGRNIPALTFIMQSLKHIDHWVMVEVFMLGILVTLVKLTHFATVIYGVALWSFAILTLLMAALASQLNLQTLCAMAFSQPQTSDCVKKNGIITDGVILLTCHLCGFVSKTSGIDNELNCPRCLEELHFRKANSISNAWALLIAAYIFYIPANILPIMDTGSLFGFQSDTIMSGVIYLWHSGSWDLAIVVFTASVMVPLLKLLSMTALLASIQLKYNWNPMQRTKLYRMVELVGKWSMLDIYVVTILTTVVQLGSLATVKVGNGAIAFGIVVVLTMFAAIQFDPRLIWDTDEKEKAIHE